MTEKILNMEVQPHVIKIYIILHMLHMQLIMQYVILQPQKVWQIVMLLVLSLQHIPIECFVIQEITNVFLMQV